MVLAISYRPGAALAVDLTDIVGPMKTLDEVVAWGLLQVPPRLIADVIAQDEYTLDVVLPYRDVYLVFDTT